MKFFLYLKYKNIPPNSCCKRIKKYILAVNIKLNLLRTQGSL